MLDCSEGAEGAEAASAAKVFRTETRALSEFCRIAGRHGLQAVLRPGDVVLELHG